MSEPRTDSVSDQGGLPHAQISGGSCVVERVPFTDQSPYLLGEDAEAVSLSAGSEPS